MSNDTYKSFINFLKNPAIDYSNICNFLIHTLFIEYNLCSSFISGISKSGSVNVLGSFGIETHKLDSWDNLASQSVHPVTKTLQQNRAFLYKTLPNWPREFPVNLNLNVHSLAQSFLCLPIAGNNSLFGVLGLFSKDTLVLKKQDLEKISLVANLIILRLDSHKSLSSVSETGKVKQGATLNERELAILELIKQGKINSEIGLQLGYSESTIRQDTIKIYRKLGIRGRQDIHFLQETS